MKNIIFLLAFTLIITGCGSEENVAGLQELPIVFTSSCSDVEINQAIANANVAGEGSSPVMERGICWSTEPEPTVALSTEIQSGSGSGKFSIPITGLEENTKYYLRAYAKNNVGLSYGNQAVLTTHIYTDPVTDADGNVYQTIQIGTQLWMKENLKTTKFCNGEDIPNIIGDNWFSQTEASWAYYNNDATNNAIYGKLYNWYAAVDTRNICPCGWHVPTEDEMNALTVNYVGYNGDALKSTIGWGEPTTATNETGFSAFPGGARATSNSVIYFGRDGVWWSSRAPQGKGMMLSGYSTGIGSVWLDKNLGGSVRCIKNQ